MAERNIESNIILQTVLPLPKGNGFESLHRSLDKIERKLLDLTNRDWKIKVTLDDNALNAANLKIVSTLKNAAQSAQQQASQAAAQVQQVANSLKVLQQNQPSTGKGSGLLTDIRTVTSQNKKGITTATTETRQDVTTGLQTVTQYTDKPGGFKSVETVSDLNAKRAIKEQKQREEYMDRLKKKSAALEQSQSEEEFASRLTSSRKEKAQRQVWYDRMRSRSLELAQELDDEEFMARKKWYDSLRKNSQKLAQRIADDEFNQGQRTSTTSRNRRTVTARVNELQEQGFRAISPPGEVFNRKTGRIEEVQEFIKKSGNALRGYTVELVRANLSTQQFTKVTLEGARAAKAMGDSLGHSIQKVALWSVATGTIFLATRAFYELAAGVTELEGSMTLLARVGRGLGDDFQTRQTEARGLTSDILKMTAAIGGNSEQALASAAVFAREGKSRVEILESVRASLLAARVAELEVAEATELMSSAMAQFKIPAENAVLTLDQLNRLSNNYRVTTGDLLQSISRSGSIIAQQNGRLSELAATTAVTAANTSRTGSEIGNAIKTIASQIDRVETKKYIFENLGLAVHEVGGESKSYTRFLLEMSLALNQATDAEKNLATTQIAGVRQRNILLAQLKEITEIIKAENVATIGRPNEKDPDELQYGSAVAELLQTSNTLESSLSRLRAQALSAANELGGGFLEVGKHVSDIITMLLRWISSGNELNDSMLSQISVVTALSAVLYGLVTAYNLNFLSIQKYVTGLLAQVKAQYAAAGSAKAFAASMLSSAAAFAASSAVFVGISIAILAVTHAAGEYARKQQLLAAIEQDREQLLNRQIDKEKNRAEAYRRTGENIILLINAVQRLRDEEQRTGKNNAPAIAEIKGRMKEIGASANINVTDSDTIQSIQQKSIAAEIEANKAQSKSIQEKIEVLRKSKERADKDIQKELEILQRGREALGLVRSGEYRDNTITTGAERAIAATGDDGGFGRRAAKPYGLSLFLGTSEGDIEEGILKTESAIAKLRNTSEEAGGKLEDMTRELERLKNIKAFADSGEFQKTIETLSNFARSAEGDSEKREGRRSFLSTGNELRELSSQLTEVKAATKEAEDALNLLRDKQIVDGQAQDAQRQIVKNLEEEKKLYLQIQQVRLRIIAEETRRITGDDSSFRQRSSRIRSELNRGLSNTASPLGDKIAEVEIERRSILEDNVALQREFQELNKPGGDQAEREQRALAIQATQLKIAENLDRLRNLEYERVIAIQEAEKNIALERKKSADEAARALGVLSKEDKLRFIAQAQFFARNPNAKVSLEQQFLGSSEGNAIGRQFFGSRYENLTDAAGGSFAGLLRLAGLGNTPELEKAQREVAKARGGRTDDQLAEEARKRALQFGRQGAQAEGNDIKNNVLQFRAGQGGVLAQGPNAKLDLTVRYDINIQPMLPVIEKALQVRVDQLIPELAKEFEAIVDRKNRIVNKIPKVAGP